MSAAILALLSVLAQLAGIAKGGTIVMQIIQTLETIIPIVIKEYQDVAPLIQNVITALRSNDEVTDEQMAQLDELSQKVDQEFEAAATAAQAEDKDD